MVTIKSEREIELMREAGRILAKVHEELGKELKAGMSTKEIDRICEQLIRGYGCIPSFLNYEGFPASVCVSINDEVVHGIPNKHRYIQEGRHRQPGHRGDLEGLSVRRSQNSHDRGSDAPGEKTGGSDGAELF